MGHTSPRKRKLKCISERKTNFGSSSQIPNRGNPESKIPTQSHIQDSRINFDSEEDLPYQIPFIELDNTVEPLESYLLLLFSQGEGEENV